MKYEENLYRSEYYDLLARQKVILLKTWNKSFIINPGFVNDLKFYEAGVTFTTVDQEGQKKPEVFLTEEIVSIGDVEEHKKKERNL